MVVEAPDSGGWGVAESKQPYQVRATLGRAVAEKNRSEQRFGGSQADNLQLIADKSRSRQR